MKDDEMALEIVRGNPTDEELAAVVAVLLARRETTTTKPQPSGWSAYWRTVRAPLVAGPDAWRSSARPT